MSASVLLSPGDTIARQRIAQRLCPHPGLARDLVWLCLERFLDGIEITAPLPPEPKVYLANHQTCFDVLFLAVALAGQRGERSTLLAWDALPSFHYGEMLVPLLTRLHDGPDALASHVEVAMVDRGDPVATHDLFVRLASAGPPRSVIAAGEGRVQLTEGQPTTALGSGLVDLAISRGMPLVPVRIAWGLPEVSDGFRRYWPDRLAPQRMVIGHAIGAGDLAGLPLAQRFGRVSGAIDALRPPRPAGHAARNAAMARRVATIMALTGVTQTKAVLQDLLLSADPTTLTVEGRAVRDFLLKGWHAPLDRRDGWLRDYALMLSDGMVTTDLPVDMLYGAEASRSGAGNGGSRRADPPTTPDWS